MQKPINSINTNSHKFNLQGPAGQIETVLDMPQATLGKFDKFDKFEHSKASGVAVIAHPHPLYGGNMDNKVVHTISKAFQQLGYCVWRFNFRGVEGSTGKWDEGQGEIEDMKAVVQYALQQPGLSGLPVVIAGFSFGGYVATHVAKWLTDDQSGILQGLVLVSPAAEKYPLAPVQADTLLIQGALDDVVLPESVFQWGASQGLPVTVFPQAGHFFHGQLNLLKSVIVRHWSGIGQ